MDTNSFSELLDKSNHLVMLCGILCVLWISSPPSFDAITKTAMNKINSNDERDW